MTIPDPTAVRAAAIRVLNYVDDESVCATTVARAYLALTDPTPLTVEVLVGRGFEITDSPRRAVRGPLSCNLACLDWIITHPGSTRSRDVYPPPRTAGHLAMLLAMMEGR